MRRATILAAVLVMGGIQYAQAQAAAYRVVENPFQEEYDYQINTELDPLVEVDGVRLTRFAILVKGDGEIDEEKSTSLTVEFGLRNTTSESARVFVIALLEDGDGDALDRLECTPVSVGKERLKETTQKFKLPGFVLVSTEKIYLFVEIER
jgi:hypothetical protein